MAAGCRLRPSCTASNPNWARGHAAGRARSRAAGSGDCPLSTPGARDWRQMNQWIADLLKRRTGDDVETWNVRVRESGASDEASLRAWLAERGVTGYPQNLLVMERFGYPAFLVATADDLMAGQYADRPTLRPILD